MLELQSLWYSHRYLPAAGDSGHGDAEMTPIAEGEVQ